MIVIHRCISFITVVQSLSLVQLFSIPWTAAHQASLSFTVSQSLFKLMSIESMMPSRHLILCCPLLLLSSIFPSILYTLKKIKLGSHFSILLFSLLLNQEPLPPLKRSLSGILSHFLDPPKGSCHILTGVQSRGLVRFSHPMQRELFVPAARNYVLYL